MVTKTYKNPQCQQKTTVKGYEIQCLLREGHSGECMGYFMWKAAQQGVQRTAIKPAPIEEFVRDLKHNLESDDE